MKCYIICIQTLCGRISPVGFGSQKDRHHLERWRHRTDATLLGAGSLREGDPKLEVPFGKVPQRRVRALITMSGDIPTNKSIFGSGPKPFIFCSKKEEENLKRRFSDMAHLFPVDLLAPRELDLTRVCHILEEHGVKRLLIEGGGTLNFYALKQKIADELIVTIAPKLLTSNRGIRLVQGECDLGHPFMNLELISCKTHLETGELFLRYRIKKEQDIG